MWDVHVRDGKVELEGTSDTFVSYLVSAHTDLPTYASHAPQIRRRFHDFVFLRRALSHDFTACVVPPLPDKHRMGKPLSDSVAHQPREIADCTRARRVCHRRPLQPRIHRTEAARVRFLRFAPACESPSDTPPHSLERFLQRVGRHPKLSRTEVFQAFLESTEWVRQTFVLLLSSEGNGKLVLR